MRRAQGAEKETHDGKKRKKMNYSIFLRPRIMLESWSILPFMKKVSLIVSVKREDQEIYIQKEKDTTSRRVCRKEKKSWKESVQLKDKNEKKNPCEEVHHKINKHIQTYKFNIVTAKYFNPQKMQVTKTKTETECCEHKMVSR